MHRARYTQSRQFQSTRNDSVTKMNATFLDIFQKISTVRRSVTSTHKSKREEKNNKKNYQIFINFFLCRFFFGFRLSFLHLSDGVFCYWPFCIFISRNILFDFADNHLVDRRKTLEELMREIVEWKRSARDQDNEKERKNELKI